MFDDEYIVQNAGPHEVTRLDDGTIELGSGYYLSRAPGISIESDPGSIFKFEYDYMERSYNGNTYTPCFWFIFHYKDGTSDDVRPNADLPRIIVTPPYHHTTRQNTTDLPLNTWVHTEWATDPTKQLEKISFMYAYLGEFSLKNIRLTKKLQNAVEIH